MSPARKAGQSIRLVAPFTAFAVAPSSTAFAYRRAGLGLAEVVVAGQKMTRTLQDNLIRIATINSTPVEQRNIGDLTEFALVTADINSTSNGDWSIRRTEAFSVSGGGDNFLANVHAGGAPLPRRLVRNRCLTWGANQVEVLRGPQSTLQERNALAGATALSTTSTTPAWNGCFHVQFGEGRKQELHFSGSGGLIEDQVALIVSAESANFSGFDRNIAHDEWSVLSNKVSSSLIVLLTLSGLEYFSSLLRFTHPASQHGAIGTDSPERAGPFNRRIVTNNESQSVDKKTNTATLKLDDQMNEKGSPASASTYTEVEGLFANFDNDNGSLAFGTRSPIKYNLTVSQGIPLINASFHKLLPKIVPSYYCYDHLPTCLTGEKGYRSASVGINPARLALFHFKSEFTNNYNIPCCSAWLAGSLIDNTDFIFLNWTGQQINIQRSSDPFDSETQNADSSRIRGLQLQSNYQVTDARTVFGSVGHAQTHFEECSVSIAAQSGTSIEVDLGGRSCRGTPEWACAIGATYCSPISVFAHLKADYSDYHSSVLSPFIGGLSESDNDFDLKNENRITANPKIGYRCGSFGFYLIASNLLDEEYICEVAPFDPRNVNLQTLGSPKDIRLNVRGGV